jgi:TerC family integral membrane protein
MQANLQFWIIFNTAVLCMLAIDLFAFQRKAHAPSMKEAASWTLVWVTLSLGFNAILWYWMGPAKALEFLTGYLIEYSLSVDNIFVFVLIFSYFAVPAAYQHRVLFWGILSALVLRGIMIGLGVAFIETFHWALYFMGAFLLFTGAKMFFSKRKAVDIAQNPLLRFVRKRLPVSQSYHGPHFIVKRDGRKVLTPLAMVLIMIEATDIFFAVDSIPAIFGITHDPFIVYTSNVCALPFCFVAIPGLSTPFGIAIGFIGACIAIGREPRLPRFIMRQRLSTARSIRLLAGAIKVARKLESFVRPRLGFLHAGPTMPRLIGLSIVIAGLALMLPLPIPFSNSIPAWAVVLLAVGMMEKDGLCVLLGHLTVVGSWVFIGLTSVLAIGGFQRLWDTVQ